MIEKHLTPCQRKVTDAGLLTSGFSCVLQMPTGGGKTWLANEAIGETLAAGLRAVYLSPTRALAHEVYESWRRKVSDNIVGIFTGDFGKAGSPYPTGFADAQVLIMTPEQLDACVRRWRSHWDWLPEIDLAVVDEFHLIGDGHRGGRLEGLLMRLRRLNPFLRIVGLSATLGNREELADWLHGVEFVSDRRPIPLLWRTVPFRKAEEKPDLLAREVASVTQAGGKSLVFAQSRRRAEFLAVHLRSLGYRSVHHHAGLNYDDRHRVEQGFRESETDVLVATSTLEVGLNLPVRQVVLYDLQEFNGSEFKPLKTISVWQRVGRAGRLGLDREGEAVLFTPVWEIYAAKNYSYGRFEPCQSSLSDPAALSEQIVIEVASGLSRTRTELRSALAETLAAHQRRLPNVDQTVDEMCAAGILIESSRAEAKEREVRLKPTPLGRIAVRHMLAPASVLMFRRVLEARPALTRIDLLLVSACCTDCEPKLSTAFEELDYLSERLSHERSNLLSESVDQLTVLLGVTKRRLLGGIKMALALRAWTKNGDRADVASRFGCYPSEIARITGAMSRILPAMTAVAELKIETAGDQGVCDHLLAPTASHLRSLAIMVESGLDEDAATLTLVPGIGSGWARKLSALGVSDLEGLAQSDPKHLAFSDRLSCVRAERWIAKAAELLSSDNFFAFREIGPNVTTTTSRMSEGLDPYRLRRSLDLVVEPVDAEVFRVTGGMDPHTVSVASGSWSCDCADHAKGHMCKHLLAARRSIGDKDVLGALSIFEPHMAALALDLSRLWFAR